MGAKDHAVVIGINDYPLLLRGLRGAVADANDFYAWLLNEADVPAKQIHKFVSNEYPPKEPSEFTADSQAFEVLGDLAWDNTFNGNRLYIYLAGHGLRFFGNQNTDKVGLLMANAGTRRTSHHIPGNSYADWFYDARSFREVVLFMDCCRKDQRLAGEHVFPCDPYTRVGPSARRFYGFAGQPSAVAREKQLGPDGQYRGLFTMALMTGLRGSARVNGKITGSSLKGHIFEYLKTHDNSKDPQEPDFLGPDNFVFT